MVDDVSIIFLPSFGLLHLVKQSHTLAPHELVQFRGECGIKNPSVLFPLVSSNGSDVLTEVAVEVSLIDGIRIDCLQTYSKPGFLRVLSNP